jgi:hypothetical protein
MRLSSPSLGPLLPKSNDRIESIPPHASRCWPRPCTRVAKLLPSTLLQHHGQTHPEVETHRTLSFRRQPLPTLSDLAGRPSDPTKRTPSCLLLIHTALPPELARRPPDLVTRAPDPRPTGWPRAASAAEWVEGGR